MFKFTKIYYEENIVNYPLGLYLLKKYANLDKNIINNHNNIEELRKKDNSCFMQLKKYLIIGTRKTQKFIPNSKVSDYLVGYTSSGCSAACLYCYLVRHYNKCSYLRLFVNREELLNKIIKFSNKCETEKVFEIGSNSDLVLENEITHNLEWTIEEFAKNNYGYLTFPTKFGMIDNLLSLNHKQRTIIRMSVNPREIINKVEYKTSSLDFRIEAINRLVEAKYPVGILIAPVILLENYQQLYTELINYLADKLSEEAKETVFFEVIFMSYSYIHQQINSSAFKNSINLYDKKIMTSVGVNKYNYKKESKETASALIKTLLTKHFPNNEIKYIC